MADADFDPVSFLERAVRVDSSADVAEMRSLLVDTLASHGAAPRVDDAGNVLATRRADTAAAGTADADAGGDGTDAGETTAAADTDTSGTDADTDTSGTDADTDAGAAGPHVVLNTHIDTVAPHVPFERDGDVIRGRGSCDAKGPLAALLAAFLAIEPDRGRVTLAVTPDEETLSLGAAALDLDGDAYVVGEPTDLDVCTAAKGRFQGTVTLSGVAAHAAEPASGVNAVAALEPALAAVRTFDDTEAAPAPDAQLGAPTLTPTTVEGGAATNQVPAAARLVVDRRSVPPETADGFRDALTAHVRAAVPDEVGVDLSLTDRESPFLEAFATDPEADVVRALRAASGGAVRPFGAATEASYFAPAPTVVFGPGVLADDEGAVAHAEREYVRVADVERAAAAVTAALSDLVGDGAAR